MNPKIGYIRALAAAALLSMLLAIGFIIHRSVYHRAVFAHESANDGWMPAHILMPATPFVLLALR